MRPQALCGHMSEQVLPLLQQQEAYTELGNLLWDLQTLRCADLLRVRHVATQPLGASVRSLP